MAPLDNDALKKILSEMDLPKERLQDARWLLRNMGIKESNRKHPHFDWAVALLKLIASGEDLMTNGTWKNIEV